MPLSDNLSFSTAMYNVTTKTLHIYSKVYEERDQLVAKLDALGNKKMIKVGTKQGFEQHKIKVSFPIESKLTKLSEILAFVEAMTGSTLFADGVKLEDHLIKLDTYSVLTSKNEGH